jgi:hypothetical protein
MDHKEGSIMLDFIHANFNHFLFVFLLISRLGDVVSTLIATPQLKLESNIIARKLGKPFMLLTILVSFIAYYSAYAAIILLVPSLLVSAMNIGKIWMMRTMGEDRYSALIADLARKSKPIHPVITNIASALFFSLIGFLIFVLYPDENSYGFAVATGFVGFGFAIALHGTVSYLMLFYRLRKQG